MILNVVHKTEYQYSEFLKRSIQIIRLTPADNQHQKVINWQIKTPTDIFQYFDWFGNICHGLTCEQVNYKTIEIVAHGKLITNDCDLNYERGVIPLEYYLNHTNLTNCSLIMVDFASRYVSKLNSLKTTEIFQEISFDILQQVPYTKMITNANTTAAEAFDLHAGVCQDHAHIMLAIARKLGYPARYVSGYLYTSDITHVSSHAWAEIWYDNAWHSFDVSNQCVAASNHIILAYGLDYLDASPIRGSRIGGGNESLITHTEVCVDQ